MRAALAALRRTGEVLRRDLLHDTDWLRLMSVTYRNERDPPGAHHSWMVVDRVHGNRGEVDGVVVLPLLRHGAGAADEIALVSQFRAPLGMQCLELPAGLVDAGETATEAALRELREETGLVATPDDVRLLSPRLFNDPGLTGSDCKIALVDVDMQRDANRKPQAEQEDSEDIRVLRVPLVELASFLERASQLRPDPMGVDAKLWGVALGLSLIASQHGAPESHPGGPRAPHSL
mmetsp:Transcript_4687/g.15191  ORF Transcript_4687/g.15191 Transcript_4687/m.15191 type:complete len:234 (+) Transcript_4687:32-733(+)